MHTFGARVKALRLAREMTQEQFAKLAGVHLITVCRWECSNQVADVATAAKVAKNVGVDRAWLVFGDGEGPEFGAAE